MKKNVSSVTDYIRIYKALLEKKMGKLGVGVESIFYMH